MMKDETEKKNKYFMLILTRYPELIKKATKLNNEDFLKLESDYLSKNKSRERFAYDISLRIQQVSFFYLKTYDLIQETEKEVFRSDTGKNLGIALEKEIKLYIRSLHELFITSFLFRKTNSDKYFRYYYLMRALEAFSKRAKNEKEFFGIENLKKNEEPINKILTELIIIESKDFDFSKCWFIKSDVKFSKYTSISDLKRGDYSQSSCSYSSSFKKVLPELSPPQRITLGFDYSFYSELSEAIHSNIGGPKKNIEDRKEYLLNILDLLPLTSGHIILNLTKIIKKDIPNELKNIENAFIKGFNSDIYQFKRKRLSVSDYVLVNGSTLGRVIKVNNTKYGYQSITVDHIDITGWKQSEITFSSDRIIWLFDKSKIEKDFRNIIKSSGEKVRISKIKLNALLDKQVNHVWHDCGAKEYFYGDKEGAQGKISEEIKKNKQVQ